MEQTDYVLSSVTRSLMHWKRGGCWCSLCRGFHFMPLALSRIYLTPSLGLSPHSCWLYCLWVMAGQKKRMTSTKKRWNPLGCVRLYYTGPKVSRPGLEGTRYERICVMLWQFNLCEQRDAISQPALLTMWITVSLDSVLLPATRYMLRANLESVTRYTGSRYGRPAPGIFIPAMRLNYFSLLRWRNWVTVTIMHSNRLACVTDPMSRK